MANGPRPVKTETKQRFFPKKVTGSIDEVWQAIRQAFQYIFQLQQDFSNFQATVNKYQTQTIEDFRGNLTLYPATSYPLGSRFIATDLNNAEYLDTLVKRSPAWVLLNGYLDGTLSPDERPKLSTLEVGFIFRATDYQHSFVWDGMNWSFLEGDSGSGFIVAVPGSSTPIGGVWHICDGTNALITQHDGTLVTVSTPNLVTATGTLLGGRASPGHVNASQAQWDPAAVTDDESTHTHDVNLSGGGVVVDIATTTSVVPSNDYTTGPGTAHHHTLTNANAKLKTPSDLNGGMPDHFWLNWYIRQ